MVTVRTRVRVKGLGLGLGLGLGRGLGQGIGLPRTSRYIFRRRMTALSVSRPVRGYD